MAPDAEEASWREGSIKTVSAGRKRTEGSPLADNQE